MLEGKPAARAAGGTSRATPGTPSGTQRWKRLGSRLLLCTVAAAWSSVSGVPGSSEILLNSVDR